jgi:FAD/FMN-containing dehydrogenase
MQAERGALEGVELNDVHSRLNPTVVSRVVRARSLADVQAAIRTARERGEAVSVAGGRHAMGGQQFGAGTVHLDTSRLSRVRAFDRDTGLLEVEAGIHWDALVRWTLAHQPEPAGWGIAQKQTGANRLSVGGAIAANAHGRGLTLPPLVADVERFTLVDARGEVRTCSRTQDAELFRLVIGGYGLFGVVCAVTLRLARRVRLERVVEVRDADGLADAFAARIRDGFRYGDFQFEVDAAAPTFLRRGVFSCYRPVEGAGAPCETAPPRELREADLVELLHLAHVDKRAAFERYAAYYLSTSGQRYWSDTHQLAAYPEGYHDELTRRLGSTTPGSEMISELYVPRHRLGGFLEDAAAALRETGADVIYGTIRLVERDDESVLAWAREPWACVVLNLHVAHSPAGIARATAAFRALIDAARARGGSYYLTYHRWATREQVLACHPRFPELLAQKRKHDPEERFESDWYRHHRDLLHGG